MTFRDAQQKVDQWIRQYGVRYFGELTNLALLMEETGELARIMARKFGEQSAKAGEASHNLGEEMADLLFVLICLANQTGIDLGEELEKSLVKKTRRDRTRHIRNPRLKGDNNKI
jgi:NTP pyrophosphatase (non-canonical NTP hydrolase)